MLVKKFLKLPKMITGYQDTRDNNEDFALTPYLFFIYANVDDLKIVGLGLCWGFISIFVAFLFLNKQ